MGEPRYLHRTPKKPGELHRFFTPTRFDKKNDIIPEHAVKDWLRQHIDDHVPKWNERQSDELRWISFNPYGTVLIRNDADALAFRLRWC